MDTYLDDIPEPTHADLMAVELTDDEFEELMTIDTDFDLSGFGEVE